MHTPQSPCDSYALEGMNFAVMTMYFCSSGWGFNSNDYTKHFLPIQESTDSFGVLWQKK
jgi:hypothetical protein